MHFIPYTYTLPRQKHRNACFPAVLFLMLIIPEALKHQRYEFIQIYKYFTKITSTYTHLNKNVPNKT